MPNWTNPERETDPVIAEILANLCAHAEEILRPDYEVIIVVANRRGGMAHGSNADIEWKRKLLRHLLLILAEEAEALQ